MLGLVLIIGLALGWWLRGVRSQRLAVATIRAFDPRAHIFYDIEIWLQRPSDVRPGWLRGPVVWFKERVPKDYLQSVVCVSLSSGRAVGVTPTSVEAMAAVLALDHLETAELALPVRDADLINLGRLTRLKSLYLYDPSPELTDVGFASIAAATSLDLLAINDCSATDDGVARLGALIRLEALYLGDVNELVRGRARSWVTGSGLASLSGIPNLRQLSWRSPAMTHDGIARLGSLRHLIGLNLGGPVTAADLPSLTGLVRLESLAFEGTELNGTGLEQLRRLPRLENLQFFHELIDDSAIPAIAQITTLKTLYLYDTAATPAGVASLKARLPTLSPKLAPSLPGEPVRTRPVAAPSGPTPPPSG